MSVLNTMRTSRNTLSEDSKMTQTQFERQSIETAYSAGEISREEYCRLMDDIVPMLWDEI